jgi:hypothetical protein
MTNCTEKAHSDVIQLLTTVYGNMCISSKINRITNAIVLTLTMTVPGLMRNWAPALIAFFASSAFRTVPT